MIWYITRGENGEVPRAQALRFPVGRWTEAAARKWIRDNGISFIRFEPAKPEDKKPGF